MREQKFPEKQFNFDWKRLGIAFFILIGAIIINALIKERYGIIWANPFTEVQVILSIPIFYLAIVSFKTRLPAFSTKFNITILVVFTIVILTFICINKEPFKFIENDMISSTVCGLISLMLIFFPYAIDLFKQIYQKVKKP